MQACRTPIAWACGVVLAGLLASGPARADDPPTHQPPANASLQWVRGHGADRCPDGAWAREAIEDRIGHTVFGVPSVTSVEVSLVALDAAGDGAASAPRWAAEVYLRSADGDALAERRLVAHDVDCGGIADDAVLVVAVALDADAALRPAPPRVRARRARHTVAPVIRTASPPAPVVAAVRRRRVGFAAGLRGGANIGPLPTVAGDAALTLEVAPIDAFAIELAFHAWPEIHGAITSVPGAQFGVTLGAASLLGCGRVTLATPWRLSLCAGAEAGAFVATGYGLGYDLAVANPWVALDAGARLRWSPRIGFVELAADAVVPLVRDTLVVLGYTPAAEPVFTPSPVGLRIGIGVGVHFE